MNDLQAVITKLNPSQTLAKGKGIKEKHQPRPKKGGNTESRAMTYLDCGGVAYSFSTAVKWLSESKKHCQDCLMSTVRV